MSFCTNIKQRLELLREQAGKDELLRSEMPKAAKASKTVPQSVLDDEQRYCTGELGTAFQATGRPKVSCQGRWAHTLRDLQARVDSSRFCSTSSARLTR